MKAGDDTQTREAHRAELLHGIFSRVARMDLTYTGAYRQARKLGGAKYLSSYKTFERLFLRWKKYPRPETLLRRWFSGGRPTRGVFVRAVVDFAAARRVSVCAACNRPGLPVSYSTVLRASDRTQEIRELARIERERRRLTKAETTIVQSIGGDEP